LFYLECDGLPYPVLLQGLEQVTLAIYWVTVKTYHGNDDVYLKDYNEGVPTQKCRPAKGISRRILHRNADQPKA
jgi:hypothetical protein